MYTISIYPHHCPSVRYESERKLTQEEAKKVADYFGYKGDETFIISEGNEEVVIPLSKEEIKDILGDDISHASWCGYGTDDHFCTCGAALDKQQ